jgi:hypothetical protein
VLFRSDPISLVGQTGAQVDGGGGFTHTTLLVGHGDDTRRGLWASGGCCCVGHQENRIPLVVTRLGDDVPRGTLVVWGSAGD